MDVILGDKLAQLRLRAQAAMLWLRPLTLFRRRIVHQFLFRLPPMHRPLLYGKVRICEVQMHHYLIQALLVERLIQVVVAVVVPVLLMMPPCTI